MSPRLRRQLQVALTLAVVAFAARTLWAQWRSVQGSASEGLHVQPLWVLASCIVVALTYAVLIETWRRVLMRWPVDMTFRDAARVWSVSNLGKYVPGKVWQITAMTVMLRELGVPLPISGAAAVVVTVANVVAGFAVALLLGGGATERALGGAARWTLVATVVGAAALAVAPLVFARLMRVVARLRRTEGSPLLHVPTSAPWLAIAGCTVAWLGYGLAFQLFARGILGHPTPGFLAWTVAYTLSYLVGYVALFAPGGLGVRELALVTVLGALQLVTPREAVLLTVASRLWLTVLEVLPGVAFLGPRRRTA